MKNIIDEISFGLLTLLEEHDSITNVHSMDTGCATVKMIHHWEQSYSCVLPLDLKNFYLTMDGLLIQWDVKVADKTKALGNIDINSIESLTCLKEHFTTLGVDFNMLNDLLDGGNDGQGRVKPNIKDKMFLLQCNVFYGKVCWVMPKDTDVRSTKSTIWFLDRSLQWHFLSSSFTQYFRMLVYHMGIQGWQYSFTNIALPSDTQKWFHYFLPQVNHNHVPLPTAEPVQVDFVTLFKHKNNEKKKIEQSKQNKILKQKQSRTTVNRPGVKR